jgi:FkbM family methyltransferase
MRLSVRVFDYAARAVPRRVALRIRRSSGLTRVVRGTINAVAPPDFQEVEVASGPLAGARMLLDLKREKGFWAGTYEPWVQQAIEDHLPAGGVGWDVGAFVGYHTLLMHRLCGPGRVVAVECDPDSRDRLETNLRLNHALGVHVFNGAAGPSEGTVSLVRRRDPCANSVTSEAIAGALPVRVAPLDLLLEHYPAPSLVKIDIEGGEADALAGSPEILLEVRPVLIVQLHKSAGIAALDLLHAAGFRTRAIDRPDDVVAELRVGGTRHVLAEPA